MEGSAIAAYRGAEPLCPGARLYIIHCVIGMDTIRPNRGDGFSTSSPWVVDPGVLPYDPFSIASRAALLVSREG